MTHKFRRLAALSFSALVIFTAACSDESISAPSIGNARQTGYTVPADFVGPTNPAGPTSPAVDTGITIIKIKPTSSTTYSIGGGHKVQIAANSVCDPTKSTYGSTEWDKPCVTITTTLTVTVKSWVNPDGRPQVHFSPDLRFVPTKINTIWLNDKAASSNPLFHISWCETGKSTCKNEAMDDITVTTLYDKLNGNLFRRVKHFSGYTVTAD